MAELTQQSVLTALEGTPEVLPDGRVRCRICPRIVKTRSALAPHELSHRREVGLAKPRSGNRKKRPSGPLQPIPDEDRKPLSDLSAVEAVTGILSAARVDGLIPTRLLPDAFALTQHVDVVLAKLRKLS